MEEEGIRLHLKSKAGENYDPAVVEQDVKAIYRMGFFDDVQAELAPEGVLTYAVKEKPYVREVKIQGNAQVARDKIDMLLVMTVHPGFGGQKFRVDQMPKLKRAKSINDRIDIEVDGGINADTARVSIQNGANVLVAGTSIFKTKDYAKAIRDLRGS